MPNTLYYGDNLEVLRRYVADESVDLVYLDPPFNSNASYNVLFKEKTGEESPAQIKAFTDTWEWTQESERTFEQEIVLNPETPANVKEMVSAFRQFIGSKPGATRKVIARNHQVLGVNRAVASVARQEELKLEYPPEQRLKHRVVKLPLEPRAPAENLPTQGLSEAASPFIPEGPVDIVERAHPDLGRLGVFWHTQGSGKSSNSPFASIRFPRLA